jgi:hypothetical protein
MAFTKEYYKSLSKAGPTSSSNLHVHIDSFPARGYDGAQITHVAQKLMIKYIRTKRITGDPYDNITLSILERRDGIRDSQTRAQGGDADFG